MFVRGLRSVALRRARVPLVLGSSHLRSVADGARGCFSQAGGREASSSWNTIASAATGAGILFGAVLFTQPAFGESNTAGSFFFGKTSPPTAESPDAEKLAEEVREGIRDRLKALKARGLGLPPVIVVTRGHQIAVRFPVPPSCNIYHLIVDVVSRLGGDVDVDLNVRASSSAVARQLVISHPDRTRASSKESDRKLDKLVVVIFDPMIGESTSEIEFLRNGKFTTTELDTVISAVLVAAGKTDLPEKGTRVRKGEANGKKTKRALETLDKLGVKIYGLESESDEPESESKPLTWDTIAGYHEQKREIEDNVLLALKRPEVYDSIARGTRHKYESNRPRAVLFEGPPGCGKTSCARVIASQAGVPLLYVPLEVLTSKYYGESERLLSSVFKAGDDFPDGCIVFLDEIDSLATSRDTDMHEATRRMLSVLLRQLDGFEQDKRIVVIAATNRKQDLDPALISRFDASITFDLPNAQTRQEIVGQYARQLTPKELASVAASSEGMSGRDLREVCQQAERKWASKLIKGVVGNPPTQPLPPLQEYIESADKRRQTLVKSEDQVLPKTSSSKISLSTA